MKPMDLHVKLTSIDFICF